MRKAVFTTNPITGIEYYHGFIEVVYEVRYHEETIVAFDNREDAELKAHFLNEIFNDTDYVVIEVKKCLDY